MVAEEGGAEYYVQDSGQEEEERCGKVCLKWWSGIKNSRCIWILTLLVSLTLVTMQLKAQDAEELS